MKARILLVEDNPHNTRLIRQLVADIDESIELAAVDCGKMALKTADSMEFDLVLMDISLPDMDGISITRELKSRPKFVGIPFIVITAHAMAGEEDVFREVFEDYISKPIDDEVFNTVIGKWMGTAIHE